MSRQAIKPQLQVVLGVIFNAQYDLCIAQRQANSDFAGFWEMPGGKVEAQESPAKALSRELQEELGICVTDCVALASFDYSYPDKSICFHPFIIKAFTGTPQGKEGQKIAWVNLKNITHYAFPPANLKLLPEIVNYAAAAATLAP